VKGERNQSEYLRPVTATEQGKFCGLAGPSVAPRSVTLISGDTLRLKVNAAASYCGVNEPFVFR
jgi:hypothetical protein